MTMRQGFTIFAVLFMIFSAHELKANELAVNNSNYKAEHELQLAIQYGDVSGVKKALSEITDVDSVRFYDEYTPLQLASQQSLYHDNDSVKRQILQLLLSKSSKVDQVGFGDWQGSHMKHADWSPLMLAYAFQSQDFINDLIKAGAKLDINSSLFAAAQNKYPALTDGLIKSGANVNYQIRKYGFNKTTPIMFSSNENINVLLSAGASPNIVDQAGNSALIHAVYGQRISPKSILSLIKAGAQLNYQNNDGDTALIYSVTYDLPEFTEVLLSTGALTEIKNNKNKTALYINSDLTPFWNNTNAWNKSKKIEIAKILVRYGARAEGALLAHTFFRPDFDYTNVLLSSGVNVNIITKNGSTPLMYTVQEKYAPVEVAKLLVDHGANVNYRNEYLSVLDLAVKAEDVKKIAVLKDSGVLLDAQDPANGHTATMFAAGWDRYESVKYLISVGANLNLKDKDGKTALDHAVSSEVKTLIRKAGGLSGSEVP